MTTLQEQWATLYAAGKVRWMAGMLRSDGIRALDVQDGLGLWASRNNDRGWYVIQHWDAPDFADPATEGCLLHQAREAWGDPGLHAARVRVKAKGQGAFRCWRIFNTVGDRTVKGSSDFYGAPDSGGWYTPYDSAPAAILAAIAAAPPKVTP
jgi:hypothetical protein